MALGLRNAPRLASDTGSDGRSVPGGEGACAALVVATVMMSMATCSRLTGRALDSVTKHSTGPHSPWRVKAW